MLIQTLGRNNILSTYIINLKKLNHFKFRNVTKYYGLKVVSGFVGDNFRYQIINLYLLKKKFNN